MPASFVRILVFFCCAPLCAVAAPTPGGSLDREIAALLDGPALLAPRFAARVEPAPAWLAHLARLDADAAPLLAAEPGTEETLPEIEVHASALREERPVGPYNQPEWTTRRRFATTRAYVLPQGAIEIEQWWRGKWPDEGGPSHQFQTELGVGLPGRFQLDLYQNFEHPAGGDFTHAGSAVEVRWAFADWGKIFLNPPLYGEWKFTDGGPDVGEVKLLLADEFGTGWHGATNLIFEQQSGGTHETEIALSAAVSYTVRDGELALGIETKVERASGDGVHGPFEVEVLLGPSVQWRPTPRVHVDFVPLFGLTGDSPTLEAYLVVGIDLGPSPEAHFGRSPTSLRSR